MINFQTQATLEKLKAATSNLLILVDKWDTAMAQKQQGSTKQAA